MRIRSAVGAAILTAVGATAQEIPKRGTVIPPVPVQSVRADYTPQAREAKIEKAVVINALVLADGTVSDNPTVEGSLDQRFGLDEQALQASKKWRFKPATKDGEPVAARVMIEQWFRLETK
jgi:TonB family protein